MHLILGTGAEQVPVLKGEVIIGSCRYWGRDPGGGRPSRRRPVAGLRVTVGMFPGEKNHQMTETGLKRKLKTESPVNLSTF